MKTLNKLVLAAVILCATFAAQAGSGRSSYGGSSYGKSSYNSSINSSSGYVYRNPYAASPSVRVSGYDRTSGTTVMPYVRTPANNTVTDNLSYRGYGTVRTSKNSLGW